MRLSAGVIEYEDSGGDDLPVLVLLHGLHMNADVWRLVVDDLRADHRCVVPTLPMGAHRKAMRADADLSMRGQARLVEEFLDGLGLADVTLVGNDTGGVVAQLMAGAPGDRIGSLVLTSCEAFDNFPPGLPGRVAAMSARMPGGLYMAMRSLRVKLLRRSPMTFGWMARRPIPDDIFDRWLDPILTDRDVRRDTVKAVRAVDRAITREAAGLLPSFDRPALVAWAADDRVMPRDHGRRLAELLPQGTHVEIPDSYTLIPLDQPAVLAEHVRDFVKQASAR